MKQEKMAAKCILLSGPQSQDSKPIPMITASTQSPPKGPTSQHYCNGNQAPNTRTLGDTFKPQHTLWLSWLFKIREATFPFLKLIVNQNKPQLTRCGASLRQNFL